MKDQAHEIIAELKRLAAELGRPPRRDELETLGCRYSKTSIYAIFGTYSEAIKAAGLDQRSCRGRVGQGRGPAPKQKSEKVKYKKAALESITVHELNLEELFRDSGKEVIKCIVQPDTHLKHADPQAVSIFLQFLADAQPEIILKLGDFLDAADIGHWPNDSLDQRKFVDELLLSREFLAEETRIIPRAARKVFLMGNHEDWFRQALIQMPQLFNGIQDVCPEFSLESMSGLRENGYDVIPVNDLFKIGSAYFTHGYYTGDNHAKKHLDKLKCNIFYGHLHDTQSYVSTSVAGTIVSQSFGCLCKLVAKFLKGKINNWEHAFGEFHFYKDGSFNYWVHRPKNGRLSFSGKIYKA